MAKRATKPLDLPYISEGLRSMALPIAELVPDAANAKKHGKKSIDAIKGCLCQYGQCSPIVVQRAGMIVRKGNGTLTAAIALGWSHIACNVMDMDNVTAIGYAIADNRSAELADWDEDVLRSLMPQVEVGDELLQQMHADLCSELDLIPGMDGAGDPSLQDDAVPNLPESPVAMRGDVWRLGDHRLLCGDSTIEADVEKLMNGERADCVFTSPPYWVGIDYGIYKDTIENLRAMLPKLSRICVSVLCDGGFAVVNFGDIISGRELAGCETPCEYPMSLEYFPVFRQSGFSLWSRRVWCKPGAACGSSRHCIGTNRAASNFEHVWTWKLPGRPPVDDQISGDFASQAGWFDTRHDNSLEIGLDVHGAGMPVAVAARMIAIHSRENGIVFEPFGGTGTTISAAQQLGRRCLAVEIEPRYCDLICARIGKLMDCQPILESTGQTFDAVKAERLGGALPVEAQPKSKRRSKAA